MGGLARRASLVKSIKAQEPHVILLDAGNVFGSGDEEDARRQAEVMIKAMALMDYNTLNLGGEAFAWGRMFLDQAQREAGFPFLSANLIDREALAPAYTPYVIQTADRLKVGVIGLTSPTLWSNAPDAPDGAGPTKNLKECYAPGTSDPPTPNEIPPSPSWSQFVEVPEGTLQVYDPVLVLNALLPQVKQQAPFIVVLAHLPYAEAMDLLRQVQGVDVMILAPGGGSAPTFCPLSIQGDTMSKPDKVIRVFIADNHPVTRIGIRTILGETQDIKVIGEAEDGLETQELVAKLHPDVLLLDLVIPGLRPFEVERWIRTNYSNTVTLILTAHDQDFYLAAAVKAGVAGFLTKEEKPHRLIDAIRRATQGDVLVTKEQLDRACAWRREVGERWASLTKREREVLTGLAHFKTDGEIAEELNVSVRTVHHHVCHILSKLNFANRREAARWMLRQS